jgi:hypothetical protein
MASAGTAPTRAAELPASTRSACVTLRVERVCSSLKRSRDAESPEDESDRGGVRKGERRRGGSVAHRGRRPTGQLAPV